MHHQILPIPRKPYALNYCSYGFDVGRNVTKTLIERGFDAHFVRGGIAAWYASGGARAAARCLGRALTAGADERKVLPCQTYTPHYLAEKILGSRSALEGERKQVTVLFADLKGSMALSRSRPRRGTQASRAGSRANDGIGPPLQGHGQP